MEKYVEQTKIIIELLEKRMTDESFEKSSEAGTEMYEFIGKVAEERGLNIHELWNAVMRINLGVLEFALESIEEQEDNE